MTSDIKCNVYQFNGAWKALSTEQALGRSMRQLLCQPCDGQGHRLPELHCMTLRFIEKDVIGAESCVAEGDGWTLWGQTVKLPILHWLDYNTHLPSSTDIASQDSDNDNPFMSSQSSQELTKVKGMNGGGGGEAGQLWPVGNEGPLPAEKTAAVWQLRTRIRAWQLLNLLKSQRDLESALEAWMDTDACRSPRSFRLN